MTNFSLIPFDFNTAPAIAIDGKIERDRDYSSCSTTLSKGVSFRATGERTCPHLTPATVLEAMAHGIPPMRRGNPQDRLAPLFHASGRLRDRLRIEYRLKGASQIVVAKKSNLPTRQDNLWEHTCFEFFLGLKDSTTYWEFNLAPAKHWNVFRFANYRQNIAEEMAFDTLPFEVSLQNDTLLLNLEISLDKIISESDLEVGITAVIEDKQQLSYWALTHPAEEADFHHRDSFAIQL